MKEADEWVVNLIGEAKDNAEGSSTFLNDLCLESAIVAFSELGPEEWRVGLDAICRHFTSLAYCCCDDVLEVLGCELEATERKPKERPEEPEQCQPE